MIIQLKLRQEKKHGNNLDQRFDLKLPQQKLSKSASIFTNEIRIALREENNRVSFEAFLRSSFEQIR